MDYSDIARRYMRDATDKVLRELWGNASTSANVPNPSLTQQTFEEAIRLLSDIPEPEIDELWAGDGKRMMEGFSKNDMEIVWKIVIQDEPVLGEISSVPVKIMKYVPANQVWGIKFIKHANMPFPTPKLVWVVDLDKEP